MSLLGVIPKYVQTLNDGMTPYHVAAWTNGYDDVIIQLPPLSYSNVKSADVDNLAVCLQLLQMIGTSVWLAPSAPPVTSQDTGTNARTVWRDAYLKELDAIYSKIQTANLTSLLRGFYLDHMSPEYGFGGLQGIPVSLDRNVVNALVHKIHSDFGLRVMASAWHPTSLICPFADPTTYYPLADGPNVSQLSPSLIGGDSSIVDVILVKNPLFSPTVTNGIPGLPFVINGTRFAEGLALARNHVQDNLKVWFLQELPLFLPNDETGSQFIDVSAQAMLTGLSSLFKSAGVERYGIKTMDSLGWSALLQPSVLKPFDDVAAGTLSKVYVGSVSDSWVTNTRFIEGVEAAVFTAHTFASSGKLLS